MDDPSAATVAPRYRNLFCICISPGLQSAFASDANCESCCKKEENKNHSFSRVCDVELNRGFGLAAFDNRVDICGTIVRADPREIRDLFRARSGPGEENGRVDVSPSFA